MASAQSKRQKLAAPSLNSADASSATPADYKDTRLVVTSHLENSSADQTAGGGLKLRVRNASSLTSATRNNFEVDVDDLSDDTETSEEEEEEEEDEADQDLDGETGGGHDKNGGSELTNHLDIQEQLAAAGPAGVAAAAAIATARKRKRPHTFETNPSVRKRQQTRLIRKLRACIDEYTMRVGQQAVVLITMPGKALHNFKVFGAQPLESVIRSCKQEIIGELEQALLEQAPQQFKEDANKHELPPLVIDGIPTPVEKMTQAQLRAFIPLMLKYSTGRGKPGWGKDSMRPPWWPETLPWANVRSDARDEGEKQRISWTTTLRQIVTNCYKYHGRDDLLPTFDESEESARPDHDSTETSGGRTTSGSSTKLGSKHEQHRSSTNNNNNNTTNLYSSGTQIAGGYTQNFVHTLGANGEGTVSLIQVDPSNAQILTLPDGTQVRAVRLQTLTGDALCSASQQQLTGELQEATGASIELVSGERAQQLGEAQTLTMSETDGQIIVTGEDGVQSCYPMSSLVSIPASMYQQFAQGGQQIQLVAADGSTVPALSIHTIQEQYDPSANLGDQQLQQQQQHQQVPEMGHQDGQQMALLEPSEHQQAPADQAIVQPTLDDSSEVSSELQTPEGQLCQQQQQQQQHQLDNPTLEPKIEAPD